MIEIKHRFTGEVIFTYQGANLEGAYLKGAYLKGANLKGAYLEGADLEGAYLEGAYLEGAYLRGANLRGANLEGAILGGAYLGGAYLEGADLEGAYLEGAILGGAIGIKVLITEIWSVYITTTHIKIGCKWYKHKQWKLFTQKQIKDMDSQALRWWKKYKEVIFALVDIINEENHAK